MIEIAFWILLGIGVLWVMLMITAHYGEMDRKKREEDKSRGMCKRCTHYTVPDYLQRTQIDEEGCCDMMNWPWTQPWHGEHCPQYKYEPEKDKKVE